MKILRSLLLAAGLFFLLPVSESAAQCKSYAKRSCKPSLGVYDATVNYQHTIIVPGEKTEIMVTLEPNQDYRLMVCAMPELGAVYFRVLDTERNPIYESRNHPELSFFEIRVGMTQQLIIEVTAPEQEEIEQGCVSVLAGTRGAPLP